MFPTTDLKHLSVEHAGGTTDYFYSPEKKDRCLLHISGVHGVEGHIGSLIQHEILKMKLADLPFQVVIVHVVNPYGKAHSLRTNGNNVDLNRNSLSTYQLPNPAFKGFRSYFKTGHILDAGPIAAMILKQGLEKTAVSVACGQTDFPDSLFFAGHELQPELISLEKTLASLIHPEAHLYTLDIHSGLGKMAEEALIIDGFSEENEEGFFHQVFQSSIVCPGRTKGFYKAKGPLSQLLRRRWKNHHLFQEFGTYPSLRVLNTLIRRKPEEMLETFFPKSPGWRTKCTGLGILRFQQLVANLSDKHS